METAYLGLGSNLGDRKQNLSEALERLSQKVGVKQISSLYETEPVGFKNQPLFLNAVCQITTTLSPDKLLEFVKGIEATMGRKPSFPNAPRIIDIDILLYGSKVFDTRILTIPHPRLIERAFILIPLAEIAPNVVHPESGKTIRELLESLQNTRGVRKWASPQTLTNKKRRRHVSGIR